MMAYYSYCYHYHFCYEYYHRYCYWYHYCYYYYHLLLLLPLLFLLLQPLQIIKTILLIVYMILETLTTGKEYSSPVISNKHTKSGGRQETNNQHTGKRDTFSSLSPTSSSPPSHPDHNSAVEDMREMYRCF